MTPGDGSVVATRRAGWWLVLAMALSTYMAMLDMTVVAVALPTITDEFTITPATSEWLILAYLLPLIGLSLPAGRWVDRTDWRSCLLLSTVGFALASLLVGLSPSAGFGIVARAGQGAFAALLFAAAPAVAATAVGPSARGRAISLIAMVGPLGAVSGYAAGAYLLDTVTWRWAFYVNLPIAAVIFAIIAATLPRRAGRLRLPRADELVEALLLVPAAAGLLTGLWAGAVLGIAWVLLSASAILPVLVWWRGTAGRATISSLASPDARRSHVSLLLESTAFGALSFVLPFVLYADPHPRTAAVALTLVALPVTSIVGGAVGGVLTDRLGPRVPAALGATSLGVGAVVLAQFDLGWTMADFLWGIALAGAGAGCFAGANQTLAMLAAPPSAAASTGASTNVARQLGFAVGPALTTVVWAAASYASAGLSHALLVAAVGSLAAAVVVARTSPRTTPMESRVMEGWN